MTTPTPSLLRIEELSSELGPSVRMIRTLMHQRKIPFIKTGRRTVFFEPHKVREALAKFEVKPIGE
jgi:excisionase family DNA binding protein